MTDKDAMIEAVARVNLLSRELDITNADHIALWLEASKPLDDSLAWLACRIIEAHEIEVAKREHAAREEGREAEWNAVTEYIDGQITAWFSMGPPDKREWRALTMLNAAIERNEHREQQDG